MITASVVSHLHGDMVNKLVAKLVDLPEVTSIILTYNVPEARYVETSNAKIQVVLNSSPKGFGANHNAAFRRCDTEYFCVLNPDLTIDRNPMPGLILALQQYGAALAAPLILSPNGTVEDSIRRFPTLGSLLVKSMVARRTKSYDLMGDASDFYPDWVGGMFMLFASDDFRAVGGFDEFYFLYYEDVDICVRLWNAGLMIVAVPNQSVVHAAQRASRSNLKHARWHAYSLLRYFRRHSFRLPHVEEIAKTRITAAMQ